MKKKYLLYEYDAAIDDNTMKTKKRFSSRKSSIILDKLMEIDPDKWEKIIDLLEKIDGSNGNEQFFDDPEKITKIKKEISEIIFELDVIEPKAIEIFTHSIVMNQIASIILLNI